MPFAMSTSVIVKGGMKGIISYTDGYTSPSMYLAGTREASHSGGVCEFADAAEPSHWSC